METVNNKNKTFFSALVISFGVFLSRLTGLFRDIIFASFLGTGTIAEAFYVAFRLPNTFRRIFAEGAFSNVFVPFFSPKVRVNRQLANDFSAKLLAILIFILLILTLLIEIFMPNVISIINPGFLSDKNKFSLAVFFSRITFPYIILISITSFFGSILNSIGLFWQFSIVSVIFNIVLSFGLIITNNFFSNAGQCLSYLLITAGLVQMFFLAYFCIKNAVFPDFKKSILDRKNYNNSNSNNDIDYNFLNKKEIYSFLKKLVPAIISSGILQINIFVDGIFASFFSGAISYLYYTDRIGQFPLSIIGYSIGVAILPSLSIAFKEKKYNKIASLQQKSVNLAIFFSIPAMFLIFTLAEKIITLIYLHGAFTYNDVKIVSTMLTIYAISIPFNVVIKIAFACFYSQKNTSIPMKISIFSLLFNVISNLLLIKIIGMYCVIFSTSMSAILACLLSLFFLKKSNNLYCNKYNLLFFIKIILISMFSCVLVPFFLQNLHLIIMLILSGCCYIILCFATNVLSVNFIKEIFKK